MKLYLKDLDCYKHIPIEEQNYQNFYYPDKYFDLDLLSTEGLQNEFGCFICERGKIRTAKSTYVDIRCFIHSASFLADCYPQLETLNGLQTDEVIQKMKKYFLSHDIPITRKSGCTHPSITYMEKAMEYFISENRIYFKELDCYKNVPLERQSLARYQPESYFDLARLPTEGNLQSEFSSFIRARGSQLSFSSMENDRYCYQQFTDFLKKNYPSLTSIKEIDADGVEKKLHGWLFRNGKPMKYEHHRRSYESTTFVSNPLFRYVSNLLHFFSDDDGLFHFEDDIWELKRLDIKLRLPQIASIQTCNFSNIPLQEMKNTIKEVALVRFREVTVRTVQAEIHAVTKFTEFLAEYFPDVISLAQIDRELVEAYLTYLYTDDNRKQSYRTELMHLKSELHTAGKVINEPSLSHVFLATDFDRHVLGVFHFYTDAEMARLNTGFKTLPPQVGRAMILHEILGLRISDTLTLKTDCIRTTETGECFIRIDQSKVNRSFEKPISKEIETLIQSAIAYTTSKYGACEYIFVRDKNPAEPMQYGKVQYDLMCMIQDLDLRDDNGNLFTVGTHTLRHVYGKRLCDMGLDDATIAALLGHSGISSVKHYRQMGNKALAQGTKKLRDTKDAKIKQFKEEW